MSSRIELPPGMQEQVNAGMAQHARVTEIHMMISSQTMANLVGLVPADCTDEALTKRARLAVRAATALMGVYGMNVKLMKKEEEQSA